MTTNSVVFSIQNKNKSNIEKKLHQLTYVFW